MYPILFQWGEFGLPSWHALFAVGAICAFLILQKLLLQTKTMRANDASWFFVSCYIAGYLGARSFAILVEEQNLQGVGDFFVRVSRFGAMTFYGGFLSSWFVGLLFCVRKKIDIAKCADAAVTAGMVALAIGRVGCFLNGDDYGIPVPASDVNAWWAVSFPNHDDPTPRYPVQLMEAAFVAAIAGLAYLVILRRYWKPGAVALALVSSYGVFRFLIEYLRGDPRGWFSVDVLTPSQGVSIGLLVLCNIVFAYRMMKQR